MTLRCTSIEDLTLYYQWLNEPEVREQSFNSRVIKFEDHEKWFVNKLNDPNCHMYVFDNEGNTSMGQVRIEKLSINESIIGISVDVKFRGQGFAATMINEACDIFLTRHPSETIHAYIKESNMSSKFSFEKAGFIFVNRTVFKSVPSYHYIKKNHEN